MFSSGSSRYAKDEKTCCTECKVTKFKLLFMLSNISFLVVVNFHKSYINLTYPKNISIISMD